MRRPIRLVGEILDKYASWPPEMPSTSLDRDFKAIVKTVPSDVVAGSLRMTILTMETLSFPKIFTQLYEHSSKRSRAGLLNTIIQATPEVRNFLPYPVEVIGIAESLRPKDMGEIVVDQMVDFASAIEPMGRIVDVVCTYYADHRSPALLRLDPSIRVAMLNTLSRSTTFSGKTPPFFLAAVHAAAGVTVGGSNVGGSIGTSEMTKAPAPAMETLESGPPPRYASVQVFRESRPGIRGGELGKSEPFKVKKQYQLEVSVRLVPVGVPPMEERRRIREPRQTKPVKILVVAESSDFEIKEPATTLVLPPTGDSVDQALFRVTPLRGSQSASDLLRIRFRLFYKLNLLEVITVQGEAVGVLDDAVSRFGLVSPIQLCHERLRQSDHNDFDLMAPTSMHIYVEPSDQQYRMTFTLQSEGGDEPELVAPVSLSSLQLNDMIVGVRKSLLAVSTCETFRDQIDGKEAEYVEHLSELSSRGRNLWSLLFDQEQNTAISAVGDWLRENPLPSGSKIQVSIEEGASTFVFAWSLLYDGQVEDDSKFNHDGFWGIRYVIEQQLIRQRRPSLQEEQGLLNREIATMYWNFSQTSKQQSFFEDLLEKTAPRVRLATDRPIDDAKTALECLRKGSSQVLYFYTHGYTRLPDGEINGVTVEDLDQVYRQLEKDGVQRGSLQSIRERLKSKDYKSDESWIELTSGRLELRDLYTQITRLPTRPLVILNMCVSAQVTPSLKQSFIEFFMSRGAGAVIGTECSMRPAFADFVAREMLPGLLRGEPVGRALYQMRVKAAERKNLLGLAYTLFGASETAAWPQILPEEVSK